MQMLVDTKATKYTIDFNGLRKTIGTLNMNHRPLYTTQSEQYNHFEREKSIFEQKSYTGKTDPKLQA